MAAYSKLVLTDGSGPSRPHAGEAQTCSVWQGAGIKDPAGWVGTTSEGPDSLLILAINHIIDISINTILTSYLSPQKDVK